MKALYYIQDSDRPLWVIAESFNDAFDKWVDVICEDNDCAASEVESCQGIQFVCGEDEIVY